MVKVTASEATVFRDLAFSREEAARLLVRADLLIQVQKAIESRRLKRAEQPTNTAAEGQASGRAALCRVAENVSAMPMLLTVDDAADVLRTTRRAVYAMLERRQLLGVIRICRRVLICSNDLLDWLDQKRAPSLKE
jgi:excisionase family DNA binding protein